MLPKLLESYPLLAIAYVAILYAIMLTLSFFLTKSSAVKKSITTSDGRYGSLDGLRGLLAAGVFIHHSYASYGYFMTGVWGWSQSTLLNHLGQTTVALFFMITGFLFTLKSTSKYIDWKAFYISRFARLFPLHTLIVFILFVIVFCISQGDLIQPRVIILFEFIQWISFGCFFGRPDVNAYPMTWTIIAGVNWTLYYEVIFYVFAVPTLYFISRHFSLRWMLFLASIGLLSCFLLRLFHVGGMDALHASNFLAGVLIAYAYKEPRLLKLFKNPYYCMIAGGSLFILFALEKPLGPPSTFITIFLFSAIVGGFSAGGFLNTRAALWLGDISYGIYLIHGLVLWSFFSILKLYGNLPALGILEYGALMSIVGIVVVLLASLSYINIERPIMAYAHSIRPSR